MARNREDENQNYYLILELDFNKPEKDPAVIEAALKKKQAEWSKNKNNPGKKAEAERCMELVSSKGDFAAVMKGNSAELEAEAKAARHISQNKLGQFVIAFIGSGRISTDDINNFLQKPKYKKYCFTIEAFRAEMKKHGIVEDTGKGGPTVNPIFGKIKKQLDIIECANLYEFLVYVLNDPTNKMAKPDGSFSWKLADVQNMSPTEMKNLSTRISNTYNAKASKDQKNNACKELAGHCQSILADVSKKKEYDNYLEAEVPKDVENQIDIFVEVTGQITAEQSAELMKMFAKSKPNVSTENIIAALTANFAGRGLKKYSFPSQNEGKKTFRRCLLCGAISDISSSFCTSCGKPFMIRCFKCNAEVENGSGNCPKCGIDLGAVVKIDLECENAEKYLESFDFASAKSCIVRAKRIVPDHQRVLKIEAEINKLESEFNGLIEKIKEAITAKRLVEAEQKLRSLKAKAPTYKDMELENKINAGLNEAREWLKKAKASVNQEDLLIDYCDKALSLCADMDEARQLTLKYPPVAASGLKVVYKSNANYISWQPSPSKGNVLYRLLKKEGAVPQNENDGVLLTETSACQFVDQKLKANVPTYYSVFTTRGGISTIPTFNKEAVYSFLDVNSINMKEANGAVTLSWEPANGITDVELYRQKGQPIQKYGEGEKMNGLCANSFSDSNLTNDTDYYYTLYAIYRTTTGTVHSEGKTVKGTPTMPPAAVENITIQNMGNDFVVNWSQVKKGTVELLTSNKAMDWQKGEVLSSFEIRSQLKALPVKSKSDTGARFTMMGDGVLYIYPINFYNQIGVIPEPVRASMAADFTNVTEPRVSGNTLYISFDWYNQAESALLLYKDSGYPTGPNDSSANRLTLTKDRYDTSRNFVVHNVERVDYYFALYACYGGDDYSSGVKLSFCNSAQGVITYEIKMEKGFLGLGKPKLRVTVKADKLNHIPKIALVMKNGVQPLEITDGIQLGVLEESSGNKASIVVENNNISDRSRFQLFFEDPSYYDRIQLKKG